MWTDRETAVAMSAAPSSSMTSVQPRYEKPAPPIDSGNGAAVRPSSPIRVNSDRSYRSASSRSIAVGATSRVANSRAVAWSSRSSSVSPPLIPRLARRAFRPRIGVEALAGLLAELARRDEVHEDLRRPEVVATEPVVEHAHDPEADVEADEVGQLERSHRMVEADPRAGVDVVGRAQALLVGAHRLAQERHQDAVDDEARTVGGHDDLLAELGRQVVQGRHGLVRGVAAADQLDQRHDRHRAEEMHAHEPLAALARHRLGEPVDRDRRGVRREDRRLPARRRRARATART